MTGSQVDSFSSRLSRELNSLDWKARNDLLLRIGRMELKMRSLGHERPVWKGPVPEDRILGADVVIPTEQGERRGRVICFGVVPVTADEWERSVIVLVPSSGTQHEGPGSLARMATAEDSQRIQEEVEMADRLVEAASAAQRGTAVASLSPRPKRRGQKDPRLVEAMVSAANSSKNVRSVDEGKSNFKVTGVDADKRIYVFKDQLRVDISGFTVDHPGVRKISDEEARDMHLGKVRGQVIFDDRDVALAAFEAALACLR